MLLPLPASLCLAACLTALCTPAGLFLQLPVDTVDTVADTTCACPCYTPARPLPCAGLSGFIDVLSKWAANMPQQQLAQAFRATRRRDAKATAAAAAAAEPVAASQPAAAAPAAGAVSTHLQQPAVAGASSSSGSGSSRRSGAGGVGVLDQQPVGLVDGSESSSGCDSDSSHDDGGCNTLLLTWPGRWHLHNRAAATVPV